MKGLANLIKGEGWGGAAELHPTRSPAEMDEEHGIMRGNPSPFVVVPRMCLDRRVQATDQQIQ